MACPDWAKLEMEARWDRLALLSARLYPGNSTDTRAQVAAFLGGIAVRETKMLVLISKREDGPLFATWKCKPPRRVPVLLDNYTGPASKPPDVLNDTILKTSVGEYAVKIGAVKQTPAGPKRGEFMPTGLCNLVFEQALVNKDELAVRQFSVGTWAHFMGALKSVKTYSSVETIRSWYEKACQDDFEAIKPTQDVEAKRIKTYPAGTLYDDATMTSIVRDNHTGGSYNAGKYWQEIKGSVLTHYEKWRHA